jgi:phospholipid/cholesterol/gamma-HCH transport system permease protein
MSAALSRTGRRFGAPFEVVYDQLRFSGEVIGNMVRAFKYREVIQAQIAEVAVGSGAVLLGGGMFFVIGSLTFFTGTAVGLEGFVALDQIGAQAYTGLVGSFGSSLV